MISKDNPQSKHELDAQLHLAVQDFVSRSGAPTGPHLEPEALVAHREGTLSPEETRTVEQHLLSCPSCAAWRTELSAFLEDPQYGTEAPTDPEETEALWEKIQAELKPAHPEPVEKDAEAAGTVTPFPRPSQQAAAAGSPRRWRERAQRWALPMAAMLLLAVGALSFRVAELQQTVAELRHGRGGSEVSSGEIQGNIALIDSLRPVQRRGSDPQGLPVLVPPQAESILLLLPLPTTAAQGPYRMELLDPEGVEVLSEGGLAPNATGSLSVLVPRGRVPAGSYLIRVTPEGVEPGGGGGELPIEYPVRLEDQAPS